MEPPEAQSTVSLCSNHPAIRLIRIPVVQSHLSEDETSSSRMLSDLARKHIIP